MQNGNGVRSFWKAAAIAVTVVGSFALSYFTNNPAPAFGGGVIGLGTLGYYANKFYRRLREPSLSSLAP